MYALCHTPFLSGTSFNRVYIHINILQLNLRLIINLSNPPRQGKGRDNLLILYFIFLWGGGALENRPHLVSWKIICAAKKDGGLGIRSLAILNKALLGKWLWRFANENDPLWKQIIFRKYSFQEGGWCSKGVRDRYGVGVWKAIKNGWENFRTHSRFIVGDGIRVKFWKDLWCENQSLEDAFPNLFNLTVNKEGWVAKAWEENGVGGN